MTEESVLESVSLDSVPNIAMANMTTTESGITISQILQNITTIANAVSAVVAETNETTAAPVTEPAAVTEPPVPVDWAITETTPELRDCLYTVAGWQLSVAIMTIIFSIVIAVYGPYVFGSQALVKGMSVATEFLEFFLPVKYAGRPADEKMECYSQEAYVSKIRRFGGFIGFTMTAFAFLELATGAIGRAALKNHNEGGGNIMLFDAHVTLCVISGITSFILLFISLQLGCKKHFLPEMMLVYSIRNVLMLILFTLTWMRALGVDKQIEQSAENSLNHLESLKGVNLTFSLD